MATPGTTEWANLYYGNPGAPGSSQGDIFRIKNIVTISFCGRNLTVHRKARRHFKRLEQIFKGRAPKYAKKIPEGTYDDWGYNHRYIAGTTVLSQHSWGLAIDLNATRNVRGTVGDMPQQVIAQADKEGFIWGGSWSNPDSMHWQTGLRPGQAKARYKKDGTPRAWFRRRLQKL